MVSDDKPNPQLIEELTSLHHRVVQLEGSESLGRRLELIGDLPLQQPKALTRSYLLLPGKSIRQAVHAVSSSDGVKP